MSEVGAPRPGRARWVRHLLVFSVLGGALVAAANGYVLATTGGEIAPSAGLAPVRDYAMVLGNRVFPGGVPSRELAARLEMGLHLYRAGHAGKIIVSGLSRQDYDEPRAMAAWLEARGIPSSALVLDLGGYRTAASMADAMAIGAHELLIVSQDYHLPRALYLADRAGLRAVGVAAPNTRKTRFERTRTAIRELLARAEAVVEVALRGARGDPAYRPPAPRAGD